MKKMSDRTVEELVDYKYVPGDDDSWHIEILMGKYKGIVYKYDTIKIDGPSDSILFTLSIVKNIMNNPVNPDADLNFQDYAGDIISQILTRAAEEGALKIKDVE